MPMIPALGKPRKEDHKFEASIYFILRSIEEEREKKEKKREEKDIQLTFACYLSSHICHKL